MSVRAMAAVWEIDLPDSDKIVLLALADCANDEGHCWPSVASLVRKCSKSERTIQGCIKRLVDEGHLTRREVVGKGCNYTVHPNRSRVAPRSDNTPAKFAPPQRTTQTPAAAADKPSRTINSEAKASSERVVARWKELAGKGIVVDVRVLDASRRQQLRLREKEVGLDGLLKAIDAIEQSKFLKGEGRDSKWKPDFDFLLQPQSLRRLIEGFYGQDEAAAPRKSPEEQRAFFLKNAEFFESIGRHDDAQESRRRAAMCGAPVGIGEIAQNLAKGVRAA